VIYVELLIRSHEVKSAGYDIAHDGRVVTVFSAPNYCDCSGNFGAFIRLNPKEMKTNYTQFEAVVTYSLCIASS
jgi:serine/threonine-protein phosphatase 5